MKKILLLCASSNSVKNFRIPLIAKLQKEGNHVGIVAFDDENLDIIQTLNVDFFCMNTKNRSLNPNQLLKLKRQYIKIIKQFNPDIVMSFVLKPNTIGVMAAHKAGVRNIYSMVEGAGDAFINNSLKWKIIRGVICKLYKKSFKKVKKVFFLNHDDKEEFLKRKLVKDDQCLVIHGVGVNLKKFNQTEIKNPRSFLMVSRMLRTKGILDYCECARLVKKKYKDADFRYLGAEGTIKISDIQEYIDDGSVKYLGVAKNVKPYLDDCGIFVLPSYYREGLPMSIMEAASVGRPILTTDNVGCRETVVDGYNGFLVEKNNAEMLAEKAMWMIENPYNVAEMGNNSRSLAEEQFDSEKINSIIYTEIIGEN